MGTLFYGGSDTSIHIEDRSLAHLKMVIATKLRRSESFTFSWPHPDGHPPGRSTLWLHPAIPLRFVFDDPEPVTLNRQWLKELANSANSSGGIVLTPELFDTSSVRVETAQSPQVSLSTIRVEQMSIDTVTVADSGAASEDADLAAAAPTTTLPETTPQPESA